MFLRANATGRLFVSAMPRGRVAAALAGIAVLVLAAAPSFAAEFFVDVRPNNTFSPATVTINVGDTVTWTNSGGNHNVQSDNQAAGPNTFRCANGCDGQGGDGSPASNAWSASFTFNQAGMVPYNCIIHAGVGMRGTVVVQGGPAPEPGMISFADPTRSLSEAGTSVNVPVRRTGGSSGTVTVDFATADASAVAGSDYVSTTGTLTWTNGDSANKNVTVMVIDDQAPEQDEALNVVLSNPTGGATLTAPTNASITIRDDDNTASGGAIGFEETSVNVVESVGTITVTAERVGGTDGTVSVDYATSDGSATAPDDFTHASGTLDWADGESGPKPLDVEIVDDSEEEPSESLTLMLSNPSGGAALGNDTVATISISDNDSSVGPCVPGETTACLNEGDRFQVTMDADLGATQVTARVLDIGQRDSTLFYFNNPRNAEVLIKILNGCNVNRLEGYWVLFAATTDRGFEITVTDTSTGQQRVFTNELGSPAETVIETPAFRTCP